jgi:G3E family GTPase
VVQTLVSDTLLAAQYRLDGLVTLVDALHGVHQIGHQPESVKQIALADRVFITKSDMVSRAAIEELTVAILSINQGAAVSLIVNGKVDPAALTNLGLASAAGQPP